MIARQDMMTDNTPVWRRLAAPVAKGVISWRQDGAPVARDGKYFARFVCYIEANTVRERLDEVIPGDWDLTLELLPSIKSDDDGDTLCAFKARLQVLGVLREDVGMGRDYKQASTDAFKRAAVRFGIAHELYAYEQNWVEMDGNSKSARPLEDPQQAYERRYGSVDDLTRDSRITEPLETYPGPELTDTNAVHCPKCDGRMWDNRLSKRNPKAPDYKCRSRTCDGVIWPSSESHSDTPDVATANSARMVTQDLRLGDPRPLYETEDELPF